MTAMPRPERQLARQGPLEFADRLAADAEPSASAQAAAQLHLITFFLDAEEFALPIRTVREVIRVGDMTRVPHAPAHVRGVINLRGRVLPVVELRTRLGLSALVPGPKARILVVEVDGRVLGLLVDAVAQVQKIPADQVIAAPDEVRSTDADYITGVARQGERLIILLDLDRALAPSAPDPSS
jgi:purine-binding chemotaxis protein CheW